MAFSIRLLSISSLFVLQLTKDGDKVLITMNEARPHKVFGCFVFRKQFNDTFDLVEMSTEPHQRQGLERAALRYFHFENENKPVYVDPIEKHGNALSPEAKGFVHSMRKEGLIKGYKES